MLIEMLAEGSKHNFHNWSKIKVLIRFCTIFFRILKSIDAALQLSQQYGIPLLDLGQSFVLFFFTIVVGLIDSTLDDWGLHMTSRDGPGLVVGSTDLLDMDIDFKGSHNFKGKDYHEHMRRTNSFMALDVVGKLTESRKAMALLRLVHLNMYVSIFSCLCALRFCFPWTFFDVIAIKPCIPSNYFDSPKFTGTALRMLLC